MGKSAERAVSGGVAVTADDGHAWQGETLFRANDMHDALAVVGFGEIFDTEFCSISGKRFHLDAAFFVFNAAGPVGGRNVVVNHGQCFVRCADLERLVMRRPSNACGLVTSCTRCRSI